ncbi:MAG: hypothetical protein EON54_10025, partial [Alcaligenaceae bacterium]
MTASAMKSIIGMTTLAAALAGCSLAPKYERPVSPVEGAYPAGASYNAPDQARARADGLAASDVGWRDFYTDPLLQEVIAGALTNNRDLRVAALNVEVAPGKIFSVRVYPWWPSPASSTKYLIQRNIVFTGTTQSVLPLKLLSFSVKKSLSANHSVDLNWTTASEVNTAKFEIEQSIDGIRFQTIGQLKAENKAGIHSYSYYDDNK